MSDLKCELEKMRSETNQKKQLLEQTENITKNKVSEFAEQENKLKNRIGDLENTLAFEKQKFNDEKTVLNNDLAKKAKQMKDAELTAAARLDVEREETAKRYKKLVSDLENEKVSRQSVQKQLDLKTAELGRVISEKDAQRMEFLTKSKSENDTKVQELQQMFQKTSEDAAKWKSECDVLKIQMNSYTNQIEELEKQHQESESARIKKEKDQAYISDILKTDLEKQLAALKEEVIKLKDENTSKDKDLQSKSAMSSKVQTELSATKSEGEAAMAKVKALEKALIEKTELVAAKQAEVSAKENELKTKDEEIDTLKDEHEGLLNVMDNADEEISSRNNQIEELEKMLGNRYDGSLEDWAGDYMASKKVMELNSELKAMELELKSLKNLSPDTSPKNNNGSTHDNVNNNNNINMPNNNSTHQPFQQTSKGLPMSTSKPHAMPQSAFMTPGVKNMNFTPQSRFGVFSGGM